MRVHLLSKSAVAPKRATAEAAGYDLFAHLGEEEETKMVIHSHETVMVGTGIAIELPLNAFGAVFARSGLAVKEGLRPANCVGVIDSDYRGEIKVALHNDSDNDRIISNGERIAQLVVVPYITPRIEIVEKLSSTDRGSGGFGSTGA